MNEEDITKLGILRAIATDELKLILTWRNHPRVRINMYTRHEISLDEHLAWWARIQARKDQHYFMYEHKGTPQGVVAFNGIDLADSNSKWVFYTSPDAPKGTGSRMEFLALEYAFQKLKLHKLCCEVLAFNSPVIKLHQKFGFRVEGVLREQHLYEDHYVDIYLLGILTSEWLEIRDPMRARLLGITKG